MVELPSGTVTFLFTDLETSTRLWEERPEAAMSDALARHDAILHGAVERQGGVVYSAAPGGGAAAREAQVQLAREDWGEAGPLRARMGLHSDEGSFRASGQYVNRPLNRCSRLMGIAHGGQVVCSD